MFGSVAVRLYPLRYVVQCEVFGVLILLHGLVHCSDLTEKIHNDLDHRGTSISPPSILTYSLTSRSLILFHQTTLLVQSIDVIRGTEGTAAAFLIATSIAFGFAIAVLAYTIAPVSGGHINPAVTFSLLILDEISWQHALGYIATQCIGAVLGACLVWGSMKHSIVVDTQDGVPPFLLGVNIVDSAIPIGSAFLLELLGTFLLVWTVCMTAVSSRSIASNAAPIAIGWAVLLAHLTLIPFTGCGINPARSFGPMMVLIFAGEKIIHKGWWIYYTAPFVGGALAALTYRFIFCLDHDKDHGMEGELNTIGASHSSPSQPIVTPKTVDDNNDYEQAIKQKG